MLLNTKQQLILDYIANGNNTFITGFAGSGKSYLISFICTVLKNKIFGLSAMTGCAAILIGGNTLHSLLSIGLAKDDPEGLFKRIKKYNKLTYLRSLDVLIIDEVSMLSDILFDKLDSLFKLIKNNKLLFGGIQLIFIGDMFQLQPIEGDYCFKSPNWKFDTVILTENMRVQNDIEFEELLKNIRYGTINDTDYKMLNAMKKTTFENNIIPTKLYSTNKEVDAINEYCLNNLNNSEMFTYNTINVNKSKETTNYVKNFKKLFII